MIELVLAAALTADDPKDASTRTQPKEAEQEEVICKREKPVSSRIAGRKVCMPKSRWEALARETQEEIRKNTNRSSPGE